MRTGRCSSEAEAEEVKQVHEAEAEEVKQVHEVEEIPQSVDGREKGDQAERDGCGRERR